MATRLRARPTANVAARRSIDVSISRAMAVLVNVLGVASFLYPFFLSEVPRRGESFAHAGVAPVLFAAFAALLIGVALSAARAGQLDAKRVALLGILSGVNAILRLPGGFGGANLMFLLPILCGYVFGPGFGFMLGASSFAVSAALTGGLGPWVPFQMWALGWVGGGAGLLPHLRGRAAVAMLAAYGWLVGMGFGILMNLWFWPFVAVDSALSWMPGIGALEAARRYLRFYLVSSLAWDSARAVANVALVVVLGRPLLRILGRARARLFVRWTPAEPVAPGTGSMNA